MSAALGALLALNEKGYRIGETHHNAKLSDAQLVVGWLSLAL